MITVKRETNPEIIDKLKPLFVGDGEFDRDFIANELSARMRVNNNAVCIVVASDDKEVVGFLIAIEMSNRHYLWLEQAYNKSGYSEVALEGMGLLNEWAIGSGKKEMRFETSPECPPDYVAHRIARMRGFKKHSTVYSLRLQND